MAGETWQQTWQVGKETTEGTSVAATKKVYWTGAPERVRNAHLIEVQTGTRNMAIDQQLRAVEATAKVASPLSAGEIVEWLLAGLKGGVTGVQNATTGQYDWTFVNASTAAHVLDPQTIEWYDGVRGWELNGAKIDELKFSGTISGEVTVEATYFARDMVQASITGSLTDRVPLYIEGWEAALYIDSFGGTAGSTIKAGTLISWSITIKNNLSRKYYGDNTTAAGGIVLGKFDVEAEFVFEANSIGYVEYQAWDAATKKLVRLVLGNNGAVIGTSSVKPQVKFDIPGAYAMADLSGDDAGTKVYKLTLNSIYDPTNAFAFKAIVSNGLATAY